MASGWKASLAKVLKQHNGVKEDGTIAGYATQDKRADVLYAGFAELRQLGFKLDQVQQFKGRHMHALAKAWQDRGLSPSTIQNNLSTFRIFARWIGKDGMIESSDRYVSAGAASRTSINREDKSWSTKGVDVAEKIQEVSEKDPRIGLAIALQAAFGLRVRESLQLRPHIADKGAYLAVNVGTKGGRDRVVPIDTPEKRNLIERAKAMAGNKTASISDPKLSLAQVKNRYYSIVRQSGICRDNGITSHGLRHGYANDQYAKLAGSASPVRGGELAQYDRDTDRAVRLTISEELGHSREDVTTHYLGR